MSHEIAHLKLSNIKHSSTSNLGSRSLMYKMLVIFANSGGMRSGLALFVAVFLVR